MTFDTTDQTLPQSLRRAQVHFGPQALQALPKALQDLGVQRPLMLSTPGRSPLLQKLRSNLGALADNAHLFDQAAPHVPETLANDIRAMIDGHQIDGLVCVGGGSAIGLAKAAALTHGLPIVAIPTTYSGSEMTHIYGITTATGKKTGRDTIVRPKVVLYDPALSASMPLKVAIPSLFNAMAHSVEALYAPNTTDDIIATAQRAVTLLAKAIKALSNGQDDTESRTWALRGAMLSGACLDAARMGVHHKLAHVLGGSLGMPHAPTHTALLPHTVQYNRQAAPKAIKALNAALDTDDTPRALFELIAAAQAQTRLSKLGLDLNDIHTAAQRATQNPYPNPRPIVADDIEALLLDAYHGRPPQLGARRLRLTTAAAPHNRLQATVTGPALTDAKAIVVAIHGRGATAESITQAARTALVDLQGVAVVAPQASDNTWYPKGFMSPEADNAPGLESALSVIDDLLAQAHEQAPNTPKILTGFSQGACLVAEYIARRAPDIAGAVIWTGGLQGPQSPQTRPAAPLAHLKIFMGAAAEDKWVPAERVTQSAAWFAQSGADVTTHWTPGNAHTITHTEQEALKTMTLHAMTHPHADLKYLSGLGNAHASEALPGALPRHQNTPDKVPYGLYAEQLNGTAFTVERHRNARTWFYRIRPSVSHSAFEPISNGLLTNDFSNAVASPELMRWRPLSIPTEGATDFIQGLKTVGGSGDPTTRDGFAVHVYAANADMTNKAFYNSDGELLIAPETGSLLLHTEYGRLHVEQGEFAVVGRGMKFSVSLPDGSGRGYVLEVYNGSLRLPERGPIGANGLADERHFMVPTAWYEDRTVADDGYELVTKFAGQLHSARQGHSPFDVVAWHGNFVPYKYNVAHFNSMGSVSFDHPDPSLLTVMTAPRDDHGNAVVDVIFFPGRWDVAEHTFRPPYLHRNAALEFSGIIKGATNSASGYDQGIYTVTPGMTAHAIAADSYNRALDGGRDDSPHRLSDDSLWIMFESTMVMKFTPWALTSDNREDDFRRVHKAYRSRFTPNER